MDEEKKFSNKNSSGSAEEQHQESCEEKDQDEEYETDASTDSENCEKCPICLLAFSNEIGRPQVCQHIFCFPCIHEWSKVMKTCPIDRKEFTQIDVFDSLEANNLLRTVTVDENISIKEYTAETEQEFTPCEICQRTDREDVMLLCDGCDKGFHMDCLDPPMFNIPHNNWYCSECEARESDSSEESVEEEEEQNIDEDAPLNLLREQPQILRTRQSERIRNAILARRSIRGALQAIQFSNEPIPSTSRAIQLPASRPVQKRSVAVKRSPVKRRRKARTKRRRVTEVVEYEIKDGQKFPVLRKRRAVRGRKRRKTKRAKRGRKVVRKAEGRSCTSSISAGFKFSNANVYELQKGRQMAGLSNFNIFEPSNQLDYVPDEDYAEEVEADQRAASTLTQSIVNYTNPLRRQVLIQKRVLENCTTTSSNINILDSILNEQHCFVTKNNSKQKSSTKVVSSTASSLAKQSTNDNYQEPSNQSTINDSNRSERENDGRSIETNNQTLADNNINLSNNNDNGSNEQQPQQQYTSNTLPTQGTSEKQSPRKRKKRSFDMFEDSPMDHLEEEEDDDEELDKEKDEQNETESCPNFSIYSSVNRKSDENLSKRQEVYNEENVDLVQMSDDGDHNTSEEVESSTVPVNLSQPASPDLENDANEPLVVEERSYTPPLVIQKESTKDEEKDEKSSSNKKDRDHKRRRRRELERYNVRDRVRERSSGRARDRFGRNRTRTRTRSRSRNRSSRKKSKSRSRDRSRHRRSRSRNADKHKRRRSFSRSLSRKRDSSNERRHSKKNKRKRSYRRTRSRSPSPSPRYHRDKSPKRRERSSSEKLKKKKHRNRSKEKPSTHTKEVFTSGQNILVSVNFNNQEEKKSRPERSKSREQGKEPVVDITAKKKINVSSKPVVAIIDLARSPFKELTPEYKKESNVIELSDSEGEKQKPPPKSPDSTKLYDPFDILNSPNENVSSSQQNSSALKPISREKESDFTNKLASNILKNLPLIAYSEENLVSSSSSVNVFDKQQPPTNKVEVIQNEIQPNNVNNIATLESPYSPGNDDYRDDDDAPMQEDSSVKDKADEKESGNLFDELFGSSSPPASVHEKSSKTSSNKKSSSSSTDPSKYLTKLKRQERVIEEVKLVIKPYYSKRMIDKEQYKEIMRKAVPKICHNKTGEINPAKIKHLIDSYVKFYTHKKKRIEPEEIF